MSTKTTWLFFSLLNKSKYLRQWVSFKDLSKSRRGTKVLCFSSIFFFAKEISCFQVPYFTLIETQRTFKQVELIRTNLDWIRPPRYWKGNNERLQIGRKYLEGKKEGKGLGEK